ncbi:zinc finger protein 431-like [Stegodyphus dumicola]|uniref:zinc finger protein 431-like n=1 Tax=Stegodyphus dumicola TaxID=202533 RepID=UPI0015ACBF84|nr:zinc finger protein 431-like [Stegodyphus dumicola]
MMLKPKIRVNVCGICNKVFFKQCRLTQHYNKHIGVARFLCNFCNAGFQLLNNLEIHERRKHPESSFNNQIRKRKTETIYRRCEMCSKFFVLLFEYEQHYLSHLIDASYECDVCKAKFLDEKQMLDHKNNEHKFGLVEKGYLALKMSGKRYFCNICSLGFYQKIDLQMHYMSHKPQGEYICDACEQCFVNENLLQQHYLQHIEEYYVLHSIISSFSCNLCGKKFYSEAELLIHRPCEKDNIVTPKIDEFTSCANDDHNNPGMNQMSLVQFTDDAQNIIVSHVKCNKNIFDNDISSMSDSVDSNVGQINIEESANTFPDVTSVDNSILELSHSTEKASNSGNNKTDNTNSITNFSSENNNVCVYYGDNIVIYDCDVSDCVVSHINDDVERVEVQPMNDSNSKNSFQSEGKSNTFEVKDATDNEKNETVSSRNVKSITVYVQNNDSQETEISGNNIETCVSGAKSSILHGNVTTHDSEALDIKPNNAEDSFKLNQETKSYVVDTFTEEENDDNKFTSNLSSRIRRKIYKCDVCNKTVTSKAILKTHRDAHIGIGTHVCSICKRIYASKTSLRVHKQNHSEIIYTCGFCHKSYHHRYILLIHERNKHGKSKPYECDACGKRFATRQNLKRHLIMHTGEKPFACDKCSKQYTTKVGLQMHYSVHVSNETYTCEVCDRKFISELKMKRHYKTHFKKNKERYSCEICKTGFDDENSLAEHILCHANEKIHICNVCQKGHSSIELLENHKETCHRN